MVTPRGRAFRSTGGRRQEGKLSSSIAENHAAKILPLYHALNHPLTRSAVPFASQRCLYHYLQLPHRPLLFQRAALWPSLPFRGHEQLYSRPTFWPDDSRGSPEDQPAHLRHVLLQVNSTESLAGASRRASVLRSQGICHFSAPTHQVMRRDAVRAAHSCYSFKRTARS